MAPASYGETTRSHTRSTYRAQRDRGLPEAACHTSIPARRQGLAREGMAGMVAWALERVPVVTLYVDASNHAAIRLYEALGFQEKSLVRSIWFAN